MAKRRQLLLGLGTVALIRRFAIARAAKAPVLIAWFHFGSPKSESALLAAFIDAFSAFGWQAGTDYILEERWAESEFKRLQPLAAELAAMKPALIVAAPLLAVSAVSEAAPSTAIVMADGADPVATGIVKSLARPGGMITGVTNLVTDISQKYLELLIAAIPGLRRVGILFDPNGLNFSRFKQAAERAVAHFRIDAIYDEAGKTEEIEPAIKRMARAGAQALISFPSPLFRSQHRRIVALALEHRWAMVSTAKEFSDAGALLTYGHEQLSQYRRAAYFADRILKGTKPADLPFEQPTRFELIVNMKTAKLLGLTMPAEILVRANHFIK